MFYLVVVLSILAFIWYWKISQLPKNFPPGPRFPLPIVGDAYILGRDISGGLSKVTKKYGKIAGMWMGSERAVLISDFEILQDLLNKNESSGRPRMDGACMFYTFDYDFAFS